MKEANNKFFQPLKLPLAEVTEQFKFYTLRDFSGINPFKAWLFFG